MHGFKISKNCLENIYQLTIIDLVGKFYYYSLII